MTNVIFNAVQFLDSISPAEDEFLSYFLDHPGEMLPEQLGEKFGLSPQELATLMDRLFEIRFISEKNGIFPTVFAALVIKSHKELQGIFEKHKEEIQ